MSDRIRIRINYGGGYEETEASPLGPAPTRGELFRVYRPSFAIRNVGREDVVRLERDAAHEDTWSWWDVVERSPWRTMYALMPPEVRATPACIAFRREVEAAGAIWEGESDAGPYPKVVISLPPGTPDAAVAVPCDRLLLATLGITYGQLQQRVAADIRARELADKSRRQAERRAVTRRAAMRGLGQGLRRFVTTLVVLGAFVAGAWWFVAASPAERPGIAAIGMLAFLAPVLFMSRGGRGDLLLLWLPGTLTALGAIALLVPGTPGMRAHSIAVVLAVAHAICTIGPGIFLGVFSLFATSTREFAQAVLGVALPAVLSGVAAIALVLTSSWAVGTWRAPADGATLLAIAATTFLLAGPMLSLVSEVGTALFGRGWRGSGAMRRAALISLPLRLLPGLLHVAPPIAIVWGLVWLLRVVQR